MNDLSNSTMGTSTEPGTVRLERLLPGPIERVWAYLTESAKRATWFAAGTFVCIATSDLLPELQFHSHDRFKLSAALILGIALAAAMVVVEKSSHLHDEPVPKVEQHGHRH